MKNLKILSSLTAIAVLLLGAFGTWAAAQEKWEIAFATLTVMLLVSLVLMVLCFRSLLHYFGSMRRRPYDSKEPWKQLEKKISENNQLVLAVENGLKKAADAQEESLIILESRINNVETRLQRVLDLRNDQNREPEIENG